VGAAPAGGHATGARVVEGERLALRPARRYQAGLDVTDDPLGPVFEQLPLTVGYDIYLRERALTPGTPDWELETWAWRQKDPRAIVRP